jgi:hypothetical protein
MIIFIKNNTADASNATVLNWPIFVRKNIEAPSRTPKSIKENGVITDLTNITMTPAHKNIKKSVPAENAQTRIAYCIIKTA